MKYLKEMDRSTILRVRYYCAACYPDKPATACCGYLERSEILVWEHKLAVMETLLLILRRQTLLYEISVCIFKTTIKLLQQPLPILPSRSNMRQRSLSLNNNPTCQIAGRGWLPCRPATETIRQSRSLVPYSGERQLCWPAMELMRDC
ncbi:uncharacterized protein LOC144763225 isoform X2 [Lissotriton helveticus]